MSCFRGKDDFIGGIATIDRIELRDEFPEDHPSYCWVGINERPVTMYNWHTLFVRQEELKKKFGDQGQTFDADIEYGSGELAFPIPQSEINANPNIEQNTGYQYNRSLYKKSFS